MRVRVATSVFMGLFLFGLTACGGGSAGSHSLGVGGGSTETSGSPTISSVLAMTVTGQSEAISWTTDIPSTSQVDYGIDTNYGQTTTLDPTLLTGHSVTLSFLSTATTYHYRVRSAGSGGASSTSADYTFVSGASNPPVITSVITSSVTSTGATINWTTNVAADSQIEYGTSVSYGHTSTLDSAKVTAHSESITALTAKTLYHYRVHSTGANGAAAVSGDFTFTTATATGDTTPPTVSVTSPVGSTVVSGTLAVTATAADNVGVVGVQFLLDGANLGAEATTKPYSVTWNTVQAANGSHILSAVARDAAGNRTTSSGVTVTVSNGTDTTAPSVSIASPTSGALLSANVTITAVASDNVGVAGVQFLLDGSNLGDEVTSSPYLTIWNTLSTTNGSHTITAVARDAAGNRKTSGSVIVNVSNSPGGSTAADTDYRSRCSDPNVVRCASLDAALPTAGGPTSTGFPDSQDPTSGLEQLDTVTKLGSLAGSTQFTQPGDSQSAGGRALLDFTPDSSFRVYPGSPTGDEFYVQWHQRVDQDYIDFNDNDDSEANKQYILTFSDIYENSSLWGNTNSCSTGELVQINEYLLGFPNLYYSCGDKDSSYQGLVPSRSSDYLYQNGIGCLRSQAQVGSGATIASMVRTSGVVTVTTTSAISARVGSMIRISDAPIPDLLSSQNTFFNGIHTITAVIDSTHVQFTQLGIDQSVSSGTIAVVDQSHCWRYEPYQWMTFQLHVKAGRSYQNDYNYHRDSTVELWAAHEGEPSQLISTMTDYDLMFFDNGDSLGNATPITQSLTDWWTQEGVTPGYGRMDFLQYESNRCPATAQVTAVQRQSNVATVYFHWANGAGDACVADDTPVVISGTPGGAFDGTWTATSESDSNLSFAQTGTDVAKTAVTGATALQP
ncbi:MAG TPA: Ig-like domain-containing protein, partial [Terriglobales bacterium]|nr:Ig-like domain-containing protein [Terriglobales bacterium]